MLTVLLVLAVAALAPGLGAQAAPPVSAYPSPGTATASRATQLSFRGVAAARLGTIRVRGSRSGSVSGRVRAHSDGKGASWIPARRFKPAERVRVTTRLRIRGARAGDFSFHVARAPERVTIQNRYLDPVDPGRLFAFRSRPDLQPAKVTVTPGAKPTAPGAVFITPKSKKDLKQAGPMIVDDAGQPYWFKPLPGITAATDFRAQTYRGKPVLTYWEGTSRQGIGVGDLVMLDQAYREIKRIRLPNGIRPDLHEFLITPQDTALLISYPVLRADLRAVGGAQDGLAVDSVIQEVDLRTGLVTFEWHALDHIRLDEAYNRPLGPGVPWDYVHANSVGLDADGDLLMSGRTTWAVYKIDRETGRIRWRLGGKRSSFRMGPGTAFAWQHDARRLPDGTISLFDNSAVPAVRKRSRALTLRLDVRKRRATLDSVFTHPKGLLSATQGNVQRLPNGNRLVGWGSQRRFTEHSPTGELLWDARVSIGFESYRAYRMPWVGLPRTAPTLAAAVAGAGMHVYASWNGATEVATWELLGGPGADALAPLLGAPRAGFETRLIAPARTAFVAVRARDAAGAVLGTSAPVAVK